MPPRSVAIDRPEAASGSHQPRLSCMIMSLERVVRAAVDDAVRPYDISARQYNVLGWLGHNDQPLTSAQLARRAFVSPQAMGETLLSLERKGLLVRNTNQFRATIYPAELTEKGHRVLAACDLAVDDVEARMLAGLPEDAREQMVLGVANSVLALRKGPQD